ncbi:MAG: hypothetical protein IT367_07125 [Candidatus Hydrogenedentes bacterium]|nr:hypothetical protein [Candidatus Hydrogenedentota bacterium]
MSAIEIFNQLSGPLNFFATLGLLVVTTIYVVITGRILKASSYHARLAMNPVLGITVKRVRITPLSNSGWREMIADIELVNVGNAPAIEISFDAEVILKHSAISGQKIIPARFPPMVLPFLRPGDSRGDIVSFGNRFVTHFFDDVREWYRLNLHRIETEPSRPAYNCSRLRIITYYRNSLDMVFKSVYEVDICLHTTIGEDPIPKNDQSADVTLYNYPSPKFHAGVISNADLETENAMREGIRKLSGGSPV